MPSSGVSNGLQCFRTIHIIAYWDVSEVNICVTKFQVVIASSACSSCIWYLLSMLDYGICVWSSFDWQAQNWPRMSGLVINDPAVSRHISSVCHSS